MDADDDSRLCAEVARGDELAFRTLVKRHQHRVFGFCLRILHDKAEAEEIAQEVFLTLFHQASAFRGESQFKTWLLRIARNHAINRLKYLERRGRRVSESLSQTSDDRVLESTDGMAESPHALLEAGERAECIRKAVDSLGTEQRMVIVLRHVEDLSYEEIAEVTGLPLGTVKSRIHRARSTLAERLARLFT